MRNQLQEWIFKKERSMLPYPRYLTDLYQPFQSTTLDPLDIDESFEKRFFQIWELMKDVPNAGILLGTWDLKESQRMTDHPDYDYYSFVKRRMKNREKLLVETHEKIEELFWTGKFQCNSEVETPPIFISTYSIISDWANYFFQIIEINPKYILYFHLHNNMLLKLR